MKLVVRRPYTVNVMPNLKRLKRLLRKRLKDDTFLRLYLREDRDCLPRGAPGSIQSLRMAYNMYLPLFDQVFMRMRDGSVKVLKNRFSTREKKYYVPTVRDGNYTPILFAGTDPYRHRDDPAEYPVFSQSLRKSLKEAA